MVSFRFQGKQIIWTLNVTVTLAIGTSDPGARRVHTGRPKVLDVFGRIGNPEKFGNEGAVTLETMLHARTPESPSKRF